MAIGVYSLLEATLLVINAIAILNEERFLVKFDLDRNSLMSSASLNQANIPYGGGFGGQQSTTISPTTMSPKMQILNLLHSIRTVARLPLIAINIVVIIFKLLFG
ncbi:immediate early response 3-interacting protein 1 [Dermatophagoides pteronyssinus]|uniref:immediate early response 3-interacting protein 1 n=1 Tax=Dermatophagoides pteronyssinus TaxID=6956 RepID=UPI003F67A03F